MAVPAPPRPAVRVRAPATSANLGPGYDSAGLCLSLHDLVEVRVTGSGLHVDVRGEGTGSLPRDSRHLVVGTLRATFDRLGWQPPGLSVRCTNRIPQSRGLGSSSAAIVGAVLAARALVPHGTERLDDAGVLELATALEGHPDNVAACLRGGFTLAWTGADGVGVARRDVHPAVRPVALVPRTRSSTKRVRGLLPELVPHADAAANGARVGLLALALTDEPGLLLAATEDRLHQRYRAPAMPATAALVEQLRADGVPAFVSGAGSTVLALCADGTADAVARRAPSGWRAHVLAVDPDGARIVPAHGAMP